MTDKDDWKKRWQEKTRGGFNLNLLSNMGSDKDRPIVIEVQLLNADWMLLSYREDGLRSVGEKNDYDLLPIEKPKKEKPKKERPKKERLVAWLAKFNGRIEVRFFPESESLSHLSGWTHAPWLDEPGEESEG